MWLSLVLSYLSNCFTFHLQGANSKSPRERKVAGPICWRRKQKQFPTRRCPKDSESLRKAFVKGPFPEMKDHWNQLAELTLGEYKECRLQRKEMSSEPETVWDPVQPDRSNVQTNIHSTCRSDAVSPRSVLHTAGAHIKQLCHLINSSHSGGFCTLILIAFPLDSLIQPSYIYLK